MSVEPITSYLTQILARKKEDHKGKYGHVFVLAGSPGLSGAAYLAAMGALRGGAGLVTVGVPASLNGIMEAKLTEAMTLPLPQTAQKTLSLQALDTILEFSKKCSVMVIGPGLSRNSETALLVRELLKELSIPVVLDADGLNAFEGCLIELKEHGGPLVVTPHYGEMGRMLGKTSLDVQIYKDKVMAELTVRYDCTLVLKGANTMVVSPSEQIYKNTTGNPGMATGGTGDVLSGVIAAFIGQGLGLFEACCLGVYLHGLAGDRAAASKGEVSLIASDLLEQFNAELFVL